MQRHEAAEAGPAPYGNISINGNRASPWAKRASEFHAGRTVLENTSACGPLFSHSSGTFPGAHQRTAESFGESGRSGSRARSRRTRANL